jgi:hypothetical protein
MQRAGERPLELLQGGTVAGERARIDHIDDGFRLGEIEATVQEGTFGKLPGFSNTRALRQNCLQHALRDHSPAMTANLHHVLAGVGVRSPHATEEDFIYPLAGVIHHKAMVHAMGF